MAPLLGFARGDGVQNRARFLPDYFRAPNELQLRAVHARGERQLHPVAC